MINTFEAALKYVDEKGLEQFGDTWMPRVKEHMMALEDGYKILNQAGRKPIEYSELPTQAAYLYAYGMPRAYFSDTFLRRHRVALQAPLFDGGELKVVSFGGGPGSELVGLLNYLDGGQEGETVPAVSYRVYDKDSSWKTIAEAVAAQTSTAVHVTIAYHQLDLADEESAKLVDLSDANLVVFSYIMSELCTLDRKDIIAKNVNRILGTMRSGSSMLFVESKVTDFIRYFKSCKGYNGKEKSDNDDSVNFDLPNWPPTFAKYAAYLERLPRMSSDAIVSKWYVKS